jgi:hypothetical protein
VNGNGRPDVLAGATGNNRVTLYENEGMSGDTLQVAKTIVGTASGPRALHAGDLDQDGDVDVLVAANVGSINEIVFFENDGRETFTRHVVSDSAAGVRSVHAADIDGDGGPDVLSASRKDATVRWFETNRAPVARDTTVVAGEDTSLQVPAPGVLANDRDPDGDPLTATRVDGPERGTLDRFTEEGAVTFTPPDALDSLAVGDSLSVDFRYAGRDEAELADTATVEIVIAGRNDPPQAEMDTDTIRTAQDRAIAVTENDRDVDDNLAAVQVVRPPSNGTAVARSGGTIVYTPDSTFSGTDRLTYAVFDEAGASDTAAVRVRVENAFPVARADTDTTVSGRRATTAVLDNDRDADGGLDTASVRVVTPPSRGAATVTDNGAVVYQSETGVTGTDRYTYTVADSLGASDTAQVTVRVVPPSPRIRQVDGGDRTARLRWTAPSGLNPNGYRVYRASDSSAGGRTLLTTTPASTTQYDTTGLTNRQVYRFGVSAVGATGLESQPDTAPVVPRSPQFQLDGTVSFGSPDETSGYRMIGLPGRPDSTALSSVLAGEAGTDWTAVAAPGVTSTDELVAYGDDRSAFSLRQGRGVWVLSEAPWAPDRTADVAPLSPDAMAEVAVPEGWSIITNPFPDSVSWGRVVEATPGFDAALWGFNGDFVSRTALAPYRGYYVFNEPSSPVDSLRIPYPVSGDTTSRTANGGAPIARKESGGAALGLRLRAEREGDTAGASAATARLRVAPWAEDGADPGDQYAPPALGGTDLRLALRNPAVSSAYSLLKTEARPPRAGKITEFTVQVGGPAGKSVELSASRLRATDGLTAFLHDPQTGRVFDLRRGAATLHLAGSDGRQTRSVHVWVGPIERLEERRVSTAPGSVTLGAPSPNPTASTTRIRYTIPVSETRQVRIVVYDALGRAVRRLVDGRKEGGVHVARWSGDVASGVYFCRMLVDGTPVATRKISVVR